MRALTVAINGLALSGDEILGPIAFSMPRGQTAALVGPSGIGKSTLLRCICGLETRYRGRIEAPASTSIIFQEPVLLPWRTVRDNLCIPTGIDAAEAEDWLGRVGLHGRGPDYPTQLSLGQQRRLALARAFATRPDLLLMDEPFVSLDPQLADEMMTLFERLRDEQSGAALFVTHVASEANRLASRVIRLAGPPARIQLDSRPGQNSGAYFHSSASGVTAFGS